MIRRAVFLLIVGVVVLVLTGCGDPTTTPTTELASPIVPPTIGVVGHLPAETDVPAVRSTSSVVVEQAPPAPDYDALADAEYSAYPCSQWAGEALAAGWPRDQMPKVLRTMYRESNCRWDVRSTTSDSGLLQINDIVLRDWRFVRDWPNFDRSTIFDPNVNLSVALWLWGIDGWTPWRGGA